MSKNNLFHNDSNNSDWGIPVATILSESQLWSLFDSTRDLIQSISMDGSFLFVNRAWCDALGYSTDEVNALNIFNIIQIDNHHHYRDLVQRVMAGNDVGLIEVAFQTKTGQTVMVEGHISLYIENNKPIATQGVFRNITERRAPREESQLSNNKLSHLVPERTNKWQTSEERFHKLVADVPGAVYEFCIDATGNRSLPFISERILELTGITASECIDNVEVLFEKIRPEALPAMEKSIHHSYKNLTPWLHDFPIHTPMGEKWLRGNSMPHQLDDGSTLWHGVLIDITAHKKVEASLQGLNTRLNFLLSSSPAIIYTCESIPPHRATFISTNIKQILGYTPEEFLSEPDFWADRVHPEDIERIFAELSNLFLHGKHLHEYRFRHQNGDWYWIRDELYVVTDEIGNAVELIGYFVDITERRQKELALAESRNLLKTIIDTVPVRIFWKDLALNYLGCNPAFARDAGVSSSQDLVGKNDFQLGWKVQAEAYRRDDQNVINSGIPKLAFDEPQMTPEGKIIWLRTSKVPLRNSGNEIIGILGTYEDITEQKRINDSMLLATTIYQSSNEAIMVTDKNNQITQINPTFTQMTGYEIEDVLGKNPRMFRSGRHDKAFFRNMWQQLLQNDHWQGEIWDRHKDGKVYAKWMSISVIRHPDGRVYNVAQFFDITEKKQKDELIRKQANYDQLTQLPNRNLFKDRLELEIKKSQRSRLPLALLFLDLDHFKDINDTYGHDKGDELLGKVAHRITACVRRTDTVARLGGDEFAVILPDIDDTMRIETITQNIIQELNRPFHLDQDFIEYHISTSIGIAFYPDDGDDMKSLMKHADQAMYAAKEDRNRFCYFTPSMQHMANEKMLLTHDLRQALARNELLIYYQPILDLPQGQIIKAEALLRWKHPQRGMISPLVFIPLAEESGLIIGICEWVLQQTISSIESWHKKIGTIIQVSVNMSPAQFKQHNKLTWADNMLEIGLPGNSINMEITEGLLLKDSSIVKDRLLEFRNRGIEVSIDDFGTGFSSLSYLKKFDIDYLKIDRSFINHLTDNGTDRALVEAIIVMAHKLEIKTIAEGVETKAQQDLLIEFGCDYAQGYLYSLPIPAEDLEQLLIQQIKG